MTNAGTVFSGGGSSVPSVSQGCAGCDRRRPPMLSHVDCSGTPPIRPGTLEPLPFDLACLDAAQGALDDVSSHRGRERANSAIAARTISWLSCLRGPPEMEATIGASAFTTAVHCGSPVSDAPSFRTVDVLKLQKRALVDQFAPAYQRTLRSHLRYQQTKRNDIHHGASRSIFPEAQLWLRGKRGRWVGWGGGGEHRPILRVRRFRARYCSPSAGAYCSTIFMGRFA